MTATHPRAVVALAPSMRKGALMSTPRRTATVLLRLTPEDREEVKRRAAEAGMSVQEFATARLLDRPNVRYAPGKTFRDPHQPELGMTG